MYVYMYVCVYLSVCLMIPTFVALFVYASTVCICKVFSLHTWHIKELNVALRQLSS